CANAKSAAEPKAFYRRWRRSGTHPLIRLIMNRLKFSCEQLSKCPDVIGQAGRHGGGTLPPPGLNHAFTYPLVQRDRCSQTPVGSGKVIEDLKKDDAPSHLRACLTKGAALTDQGR